MIFHENIQHYDGMRHVMNDCSNGKPNNCMIYVLEISITYYTVNMNESFRSNVGLTALFTKTSYQVRIIKPSL